MDCWCFQVFYLHTTFCVLQNISQWCRTKGDKNEVHSLGCSVSQAVIRKFWHGSRMGMGMAKSCWAVADSHALIPSCGEQQSCSMAQQLLLLGAHGAGKHSPASGNVRISGAVHPGESFWRLFWAQKNLLTFVTQFKIHLPALGWAGAGSELWLCPHGPLSALCWAWRLVAHTARTRKKVGRNLEFAAELPKSCSLTFSSPYPEGVALEGLQTHLFLSDLWEM